MILTKEQWNSENDTMDKTNLPNLILISPEYETNEIWQSNNKQDEANKQTEQNGQMEQNKHNKSSLAYTHSFLQSNDDYLQKKQRDEYDAMMRRDTSFNDL